MPLPFTFFLSSLREPSFHPPAPAVAVEPLRNRAVARIRALIQALRGRSPATSELDQLRELLDSVDLTEPDAGLAALHLRKAQRFLRSAEVGSALYELRLLLACLTGV